MTKSEAIRKFKGYFSHRGAPTIYCELVDYIADVESEEMNLEEWKQAFAGSHGSEGEEA